MPPRTIDAGIAPGQSVSFVWPPGVELTPESVYAEIDASGAGDTTATLTITDGSGVVIAKKRQGEVIDGGSQGSATWALRLDDKSAASGAGPSPATSVVTEQTFSQGFAVGVSSKYARADHTHGTPPTPGVPAAVYAVAKCAAFFYTPPPGGQAIPLTAVESNGVTIDVANKRIVIVSTARYICNVRAHVLASAAGTVWAGVQLVVSPPDASGGDFPPPPATYEDSHLISSATRDDYFVSLPLMFRLAAGTTLTVLAQSSDLFVGAQQPALYQNLRLEVARIGL